MKNFRKNKAFIISLKNSDILIISLTDTQHLRKPIEVVMCTKSSCCTCKKPVLFNTSHYKVPSTFYSPRLQERSYKSKCIFCFLPTLMTIRKISYFIFACFTANFYLYFTFRSPIHTLRLVQIFEQRASKHLKISFKNTIFQHLTLDLQLSFILKLFPFLKLYFSKASRTVLKVRNHYNQDLKNGFPFPFLLPQAISDCLTKVINTTS